MLLKGPCEVCTAMSCPIWLLSFPGRACTCLTDLFLPDGKRHNSLAGVSERLEAAFECDHKSGDKRVVILHADEWRKR